MTLPLLSSWTPSLERNVGVVSGALGLGLNGNWTLGFVEGSGRGGFTE